MAQVVPLDETGSDADVIENVFDGEGYDEEYDEEFDLEFELASKRKNWLLRDLERFWQGLTYEYLKQSMDWFLISASLSFSCTVC